MGEKIERPFCQKQHITLSNMLFAIIILFLGAIIMLKVKQNIRMETRRKQEKIQSYQMIETILKELNKSIKNDELHHGEPAWHLLGPRQI
jgi:hypothetical protein